ncbi:MAG TPA: L,D-transpeptidase family protein [Planctomycetota bacterium]|nr:L,D-transpeptidase family protein [Planctomycetota bacterium]
MGVFKDDQLVAKVLGQPHTLKKRNSGKIFLFSFAVALIALTTWLVVTRKFPGLTTASASTTAAQNDAPPAHPAQASALKPVAEILAPEPLDATAAHKPAPSEKKSLPPVIEDFRVEPVELNPRFAVKLIDSAPTEDTGRDKSDAQKNAPSSAADLFEEAKRIEDGAKNNAAQLERARALYQRALESGALQNPQDTHCLMRLNDLTARLILDPKTPCTEPKAEFHKVEQGEVAERIARKYKINIGQLKRINHLNDKLIVRIGQNLKMLPGEVVFRVDREKLTGTLYIDGVFIKRYPIGIGPGNSTPKGTFTVENKVINPDWFYEGKKVPSGDAKNILGSRWMGMANTVYSANGAGLGVHGTSMPESVPGRESKGCVRMHNEDVEELYDFMPQGGKVIIE